MKAASSLRVQNRLDPYQSFCIYDLVQRLDIELRFMAIPSMEGLYTPGEPPIITISSLRPSGRQRFTCAHELGHHVFGHGTRIDDFASPVIRRGFDPVEFLVDCFAGFLLMPKVALLSAMRARDIDPRIVTAGQLFLLAGYFGVGYRTIIHHLERNLRLIDGGRAAQLSKVQPRSIREGLVPGSHNCDVFVVDTNWIGRPVDLHAGDYVLLPPNAIVDPHFLAASPRKDGNTYIAQRPGISRVSTPGESWAAYVRVAARDGQGNFIGRSIYRHERADDVACVH
jgi:Zn-dependent peptidase ImmA (M78 family)